ncbi:MAG: hypothetical protein ACFFDT_07715 [Candidatus Hodarchaeota archaeon]
MITCDCGKQLYKLSNKVYVCRSCGKLWELQLRELGKLSDEYRKKGD